MMSQFFQDRRLILILVPLIADQGDFEHSSPSVAAETKRSKVGVWSDVKRRAGLSLDHRVEDDVVVRTKAFRTELIFNETL